MKRTQQFWEKTFFAVSALGAAFVLLETVLRAYGTSICGGAGCKLVSSHTRFSEYSILLAGLAVFCLLALLAFLTAFRERLRHSRTIDLVLVAALAGEGFFTGYQTFRLHAACVFCLSVFAFLVVLGLLRILAGHREPVAGFAALATVFVLFYLVLPVDTTAALPEGKSMLLFYSESCKHCQALLKELDERHLQVEHVLADDYVSLLKGVGVQGVPTLYVNNGSEKLLVTGKDEILAYLLSMKKQPGRRQNGNGGRQRLQRPLNESLLNNGGGLRLVLPPPDEGSCKQDKDCK